MRALNLTLVVLLACLSLIGSMIDSRPQADADGWWCRTFPVLCPK